MNVSNFQPLYKDGEGTQIFTDRTGPGRFSKAIPQTVGEVTSPHGGCARLRPSAKAINVIRNHSLDGASENGRTAYL
mgnify:CR=1 FL=1